MKTLKLEDFYRGLIGPKIHLISINAKFSASLFFFQESRRIRFKRVSQ